MNYSNLSGTSILRVDTTDDVSSTSCLEKHLKKESKENNMSLCVGLITDDSIYLACDSRETRTYQDHNGFLDDYHKISIIPGTNIAVMISGSIRFNDKSLTDVVESMTSRNVSDATYEFKEITGPAKTDLIVAGFPFSEEEQNIGIYQYDSFWIPKKQNKVIPYLFSSGVDYANKAVNFFNEQHFTIAGSPESFINVFFDGIIKLSSLCDNTVHGPVRILKISRSGGCEWIQR